MAKTTIKEVREEFNALSAACEAKVKDLTLVNDILRTELMALKEKVRMAALILNG
jgi:hypothetical protein